MLAAGLALPAAAAKAGDDVLLYPEHYGVQPTEGMQSVEFLYPGVETEGYSFEKARKHVASIPLLTGGIFAATLAIGILDWKWGSAEFHFSDEGFFGKDTHDLGMDKLGHAFGTYLLTDAFTYAIRRKAADPQGAELTAVALSLGVMTTVELLDGFSGYGFSWQDIVMNALGAGFSYTRNTVPGLREKLDFRFEYIPSGNDNKDFSPYSDYSGQKYLLALKLSGFKRFEDTPLRFVELQAGYFARGFTDKEKAEGDELRREPYIGIGVNLSELLFSHPKVRDTPFGRMGRATFEYVQVPYTYAAYPYN
jgi:hypothetical protein